jgi:hypothetical protein
MGTRAAAPARAAPAAAASVTARSAGGLSAVGTPQSRARRGRYSSSASRPVSAARAITAKRTGACRAASRTPARSVAT